MKWRLTSRFVLSIITVVLIVILVNSILTVGFFITRASGYWGNKEAESAEDFTRALEKHIQLKDDKPVLDASGKKKLTERKAWVQFLNKAGQEVGSYKKPKKVPTAYAPIDIVQQYKYKEVDAQTTTYFGQKGSLTYMVGVADSKNQRIVFNLNKDSLFLLSNKVLLFFLVVDLLIALLVGFFFSKRLAAPLYKLIEGIRQLQKRRFNKQLPIPRGVYAEVFNNVNDLAATLDNYEKQRQQLEEMREDWIRNISHDLKTPMASIRGYAEFIKEDAATLKVEELKEYTQIIEKKSIYIQELIDDLNLTTKLKNPAQSLTKQSTNMVSFMREMVIELLNDPKFQAAELEFIAEETNIETSIDQKLIKRALLNIIYNALLHNKEDVQVQVQVEKAESPYRVKIRIEDNGKGIPAREQPFLFERYYRGTNTENNYGTGLGMAIARDIVQAHQGEIELTSKEGSGTKLNIYL